MTINLWRDWTRSRPWNPNVWQKIAMLPGVPVKVSAHILAHGWQRVLRCVTETRCLWSTWVFCLSLCAWRLCCKAQEKAVLFLPIKQPRASYHLSSCYRILPWFHGRKQIYISSSEKYNDFTFPQFLLIQFLSDTGAHLFISRLCLQSLANSHIRFLTPRIMIPGPGCFFPAPATHSTCKTAFITLLLGISLTWIHSLKIVLNSKAYWSPKNQLLQPHSEGVP